MLPKYLLKAATGRIVLPLTIENSMNPSKICFIGAGNMARAIISGLVGSGYPADHIQASNPSRGKLDALSDDFAILTTCDNHQAVQWADVVVLAVKPQLMEAVCQPLADIDFSDKLVITIAAGIPVARYRDYLSQSLRLIRTMPNTPAQIGFGMTGLYAPADISQQDRDIATRLMQAGGEVVWVKQESDLNLVIALAGSSPAYFFLFMEAMVSAAEKLGMDERQARALAQQAALGAAQMVIHNPDTPLSTLRQNVTSKGGTTAEAIATFEQGNLRDLVDEAMVNCIKRADEMAKTF